MQQTKNISKFCFILVRAPIKNNAVFDTEMIPPNLIMEHFDIDYLVKKAKYFTSQVANGAGFILVLSG